MKFWLDAHLPPSLAGRMQSTFGVDCRCVRDLGLRDSEDTAIFDAARAAGAVVMTKDDDFVRLIHRHGPPPQIVWLTCGNTSNAALRELFPAAWPDAKKLIEAGEALIEIGARSQAAS